MKTILKANKLQVLLNEGFSMKESLDLLLEEHKIEQAKTKQWTYKGDFKCPVCQAYSKLYTSGKYMKLTCKRHGLFVKVDGGYWKNES